MAAVTASPAAVAPETAATTQPPAGACADAPARARIGVLPGTSPSTVARVADQVSDRRRRSIERDIARRVAAAYASQRASSRPLARGVGPVSDLTVRIPVHAHVVDGRRPSDAPGPEEPEIQRQIDVLNDAFSGGQSERAAVTPFRFHLLSYERVVRDRWHRAAPDSRAERRMKEALGAGAGDELDLYFSEPSSVSGEIALGSASFPWEIDGAPRADGVVVHTASMPGGDARGYGRGDSAVHEVGHWLGLFHTFEGGCGSVGDMVDDTPREAAPSYRCGKRRDTCPSSKGNDPVRNFMDYSRDACMDRFTPDQADRMSRAWLAYRAR